MNDADRYQLLHGSYRTPRFRYGAKVLCEVRGEPTICGLTEAPIPWPLGRRGRGKPSPVVCGALARAVRRESEQAICHWWGVCPTTVWRWRKALGVPQHNEGTARLHRNWGAEILTGENLERAVRAASTPEANAKKAAAKRGRPMHPNSRAALDRARKRPFTAEHRRHLSEARRRLGHRPPVGELWTPEEDALLGTMPEADVSRRTGRTVVAIRDRRRVLRIPSFFRKGPRMRNARSLPRPKEL
jgi:hypothetical protein